MTDTNGNCPASSSPAAGELAASKTPTGAPAAQHCPVHAEPGADVLHAWPCPDDCRHFSAELERRVEDVHVHGNYTRTWTDDNGFRYRQRFRNHQPVEEPSRWPPSLKEES